MDNIAVGILRLARSAGFSVELEDGALQVKGPSERTDVIKELRDHREEIIEAITHPPSGVAHYRDRMAKGIEWLDLCWEKLTTEHHGDQHDSMIEAIGDNMQRWYNLDEELRRVYPEFRGCPVGGCKSVDALVCCMHCTPPAEEQGRA